MTDREDPTSAMISSRGIKTAKDFVDFFGALMDDLVSNRIDPDTARSACMAGDVMLRVVKMQREYSNCEAMPLVPQKQFKKLPEETE
jgi:hypothetical protein